MNIGIIGQGFVGNAVYQKFKNYYDVLTYDLDESKTDTGIFGINIHRATGKKGGKSTRVDKWSAGCQVIADNDDWHEFLDICQAAREIHGNSFSYTLLESKDIA